MLLDLGHATAVEAGDVVVADEVELLVLVDEVVVPVEVGTASMSLAPAMFAFGTAAPRLDFR